MKRFPILLSTLGLVLVSTGAFADETTATTSSTSKDGTITLKNPIIIEGRAPRPIAAVEVARTRMQLGVTTPTLSGVGRIQDAAKKEPF
jgi:hypothetical protein